MTFWEEKRNDLYCSMLRSPAATLLKNGQQNSLALHRDNLMTTLTQPLGLSRPVTGAEGWFCKWISGAGEATSCWEIEQKTVQQLRTKFQHPHMNLLLLSFITPFPNDLLKPTSPLLTLWNHCLSQLPFTNSISPNWTAFLCYSFLQVPLPLLKMLSSPGFQFLLPVNLVHIKLPPPQLRKLLSIIPHCWYGFSVQSFFNYRGTCDSWFQLSTWNNLESSVKRI